MNKTAKEFSREIFHDKNEQERYLQWDLEETVKEIEARRTKPSLDSTELWVTIRNTNWNNEDSHRKFYDTAIQIPGAFALGTLISENGVKTPLRLSLDLAALDAGYVRNIDTRLPWAVGGALAIKHDLKDPSDDSTLGMEEVEEVDALFRFRSLGWVLMEQETQWGEWHWKETGHILVVDLHRNLHPWFVVAKDWYDGDKGDAGEIVEPQSRLQEGERYGPGISPGDTHWTPVGKLEGNFSGNMQYWFHENATFKVKRTGGRKKPRLPLIMEWFRDDNGDAVAYYSQDKECYRYRNGKLVATTSRPAPPRL
ncbi:hypothetical protein MMC17_000249 [Xylographa soralifera]|nr:hypothetical protein [Xylographa soralifera]